ncbi:FHA domain-containing protein [Segetibacter koreensis]|uniref:FHA domain-containing protein n=1 Tax=Segetibacter koreensis TaxID=398037 RepID=UPI00037C93A9|nr:FHA domain-containing protein [Segetibacter koreensis]
MFDFLKSRPGDTKGIRGELLQFIKDQLQKAEGGEGKNIRGIYLYITCKPEEKHLYEGAIYADEENRFKEEEVQKIADDFAIDLPSTWTMQISFVDEAPPEAIKAQVVDAALFISTKKKPKIHATSTAYIRVLNGEAEKPVYTITSTSGKINIGRERKAQTAEGFYRENQIAFIDASKHESNRSVSREHAHIQWDTEASAFYIFADEGGIPPHNKMKVRTEGGTPVKFQTTQIGHRLQEGDQIVLGESAVLEFRTSDVDK